MGEQENTWEGEALPAAALANARGEFKGLLINGKSKNSEVIKSLSPGRGI
jgi:hypothetical protein